MLAAVTRKFRVWAALIGDKELDRRFSYAMRGDDEVSYMFLVFAKHRGLLDDVLIIVVIVAVVSTYIGFHMVAWASP